jgi:hypothetical protein
MSWADRLNAASGHVDGGCVVAKGHLHVKYRVERETSLARLVGGHTASESVVGTLERDLSRSVQEPIVLEEII